MPHVEVIPNSLSEGREIIVEGVVSPSANRFNITFCKDRDSHHLTPLVFDVRFNENVVVRNHNHNGWGPEERHGGLPFRKGEHYRIKFVVKCAEFQIFVNDNHFCDFKHRISKEEARHVVVDGDFAVQRVHVSHHDSHSGVFNNPCVPFIVPIRVKSGSKITVTGIPASTDRFSVNFACGPSVDLHDIAFHFDVRFNYGNDKRKVIRNHKSRGHWGTEERKDDFPFAADNICQILFKIKEDRYKVVVNDEKYCTHFCQIKSDQVTHLIILGDIKLHKVEIQH